MINTAPPASNSVYSREKLFWYDKINFWNHVCHRGAVVKELLERADKPGSTPGNAVFCFFVPFFFFFSPVWSLFFNTIFPFGLFFFILTADPAGHALGSIIQVRSFILDKVFQKLCPSSETADFVFSVLVDIMTNNTQYTTNCTSFAQHPPVTHWRNLNLPFEHRLNHQYHYAKISTGFAPKN